MLGLRRQTVKNSPHFLKLFGVMGALFFIAGCSSSSELDPMETSAGALAKVLVRYNIAERGNLPKDEETLRQYVAANASDILAKPALAIRSQLFVSPRDGQPLKFVLGNDRRKLTLEGNTVVAFEQQGKDGNRWVICRTGTVDSVPEGELATLGL